MFVASLVARARRVQPPAHATVMIRRAIGYIPEVEGVPAAGAFSRATTLGDMVYVSGTGASNDTATGLIEDMSAGEETTRALENVGRILRAAGSAPHRIVSATMLLTNKDDYKACNQAYVDFFAEHGGAELPARSTALWGVPTTAKVAFSVVATKRHAAFGQRSSSTAVKSVRQDIRRVKDMRREYEAGALDEQSCGDDPMRLFRLWFDAACEARMPEPNAMWLTTVDDATTQPSSRVVLLKGFDGEGFRFYTNYTSRKARELATNPRCQLSFLWLPMERQVRIEGHATRLPSEESAAYFSSRPRGSQIGAWASRQSTVIPSAADLAERERRLIARFEGADVPMPDFWGGFIVRPTRFEFWQGRTSRLHDRITFRQDESLGEWACERLSP